MAFAASAVAPITGRFRNRIIRDLVLSITVGTIAATYWWKTSHVPKMEMYKSYDKRVREELIKEHGAWAIGPGQQERLEARRGEPTPNKTVE
ncbi:hypothetical protein DFS34DRAFT_612048 [Phlyctochytrium arcticum]|nr:hypothetical protein DFS34DRAFT_612048 [Phlyctochytrium arcticum]